MAHNTVVDGIYQYVGPNRMLPTMVTLWGVVCMMQGVCANPVVDVLDLMSAGLIQDYRGLLICQCFLGLFEGACRM
jgi:hypothetical protein